MYAHTFMYATLKYGHLMLESSLFSPGSSYLGVTLEQCLYILKGGRKCLELAQQSIQSLSDLPWGHRQPWLLPELLNLLPDLAQLNHTPFRS